MIDVKKRKWARRRPGKGADLQRKPCGLSLAISIADLCSAEGLKAGCQAIGAARVGGTEEQILFVIDANTHCRAEESLELDDLMAHRFIQLSGIQRGDPLLEKGFVGHPAMEYAWCSHRFGNVHPEFDQVNHHLDIRGDDGLDAGTPDYSFRNRYR